MGCSLGAARVAKKEADKEDGPWKDKKAKTPPKDAVDQPVPDEVKIEPDKDAAFADDSDNQVKLPDVIIEVKDVSETEGEVDKTVEPCAKSKTDEGDGVISKDENETEPKSTEIPDIDTNNDISNDENNRLSENNEQKDQTSSKTEVEAKLEHGATESSITAVESEVVESEARQSLATLDKLLETQGALDTERKGASFNDADLSESQVSPSNIETEIDDALVKRLSREIVDKIIADAREIVCGAAHENVETGESEKQCTTVSTQVAPAELSSSEVSVSSLDTGEESEVADEVVEEASASGEERLYTDEHIQDIARQIAEQVLAAAIETVTSENHNENHHLCPIAEEAVSTELVSSEPVSPEPVSSERDSDPVISEPARIKPGLKDVEEQNNLNEVKTLESLSADIAHLVISRAVAEVCTPNGESCVPCENDKLCGVGIDCPDRCCGVEQNGYTDGADVNCDGVDCKETGYDPAHHGATQEDRFYNDTGFQDDIAKRVKSSFEQQPAPDNDSFKTSADGNLTPSIPAKDHHPEEPANVAAARTRAKSLEFGIDEDNEEVHAAAAKIQSLARGFHARQEVKQRRMRAQSLEYGIDPDDPDVHQAATKIQNIVRGHKARKRVKMLKVRSKSLEYGIDADDPQVHHAASKIQALVRGHKTRCLLHPPKKRHKLKRRHSDGDRSSQAAVRIQAVVRGHEARKRVKALKVKRQCSDRTSKHPDTYDASADRAATKIQSVVRGRKARKDVKLKRVRSQESAPVDIGTKGVVMVYEDVVL